MRRAEDVVWLLRSRRFGKICGDGVAGVLPVGTVCVVVQTFDQIFGGVTWSGRTGCGRVCSSVVECGHVYV